MSAQESSCGPSQRGRLPPLPFLACPVPAKAGRWWLPEHPILSCLLSFPILFPLWLLWLSPRYTLSILWDQLKSHRLSHFLNPFLLSVMSYWHHYPWSQQGPAVGRVFGSSCSPDASDTWDFRECFRSSKDFAEAEKVHALLSRCTGEMAETECG